MRRDASFFDSDNHPAFSPACAAVLLGALNPASTGEALGIRCHQTSPQTRRHVDRHVIGVTGTLRKKPVVTKIVTKPCPTMPIHAQSTVEFSWYLLDSP